jgi:hypothetical protein
MAAQAMKLAYSDIQITFSYRERERERERELGNVSDGE